MKKTIRILILLLVPVLCGWGVATTLAGGNDSAGGTDIYGPPGADSNEFPGTFGNIVFD